MPRNRNILPSQIFNASIENILYECIQFFNEYKEAGLIKNYVKPVPYICSKYYDSLLKIGAIERNEEREIKIYRQKKIEILENISKQIGRTISQSSYDYLEKNINKTNYLLYTIKEEFLIDYFDGLLELGEDLEEIINKKLK